MAERLKKYELDLVRLKAPKIPVHTPVRFIRKRPAPPLPVIKRKPTVIVVQSHTDSKDSLPRLVHQEAPVVKPVP